MSKKTDFRFFVADERRCSLTWSLTIQQNDIYVSHSGSRQDKISLHASGSYQWSIRSEHVESVPFAQDNRHLAKWKNPPRVPNSLTRQFFVLIPTSELEPNRPRPVKQATHLHPPPTGWATMVHFIVFTPETGKQVSNIVWQAPPLFEKKLASGEILIVKHSEGPIDAPTKAKLILAKEMGQSEGKNHGKKTARMLARITDMEGISGLAEVIA